MTDATEPAVPQGREPVAVTGQPSDGELLQMMPEQFRADLATVSRMAAHGAGTGVTPGVFRVSLNTGALDYARAVLARWGNHAPAPPADGEVAELPPRPPLITPPAHPALERYGITWDGSREKPVLTLLPDGYWTPWHVAAELLQRQAPVPVSERLPGPKDCDAEGRCWWGTPDFVNSCTVTQSAQWRLSAPDDRFGSELFWLPAHALPLPEVGE